MLGEKRGNENEGKLDEHIFKISRLKIRDGPVPGNQGRGPGARTGLGPARIGSGGRGSGARTGLGPARIGSGGRGSGAGGHFIL